jgi:hypothetical protein
MMDECNGRIQPDGTYGYHATLTFPYMVGCLKGTPMTQSGAAAAPKPPMGGNNQPPQGGNGQHPHSPLGGVDGHPPGGKDATPSTVKSNSVESLSVNHFAANFLHPSLVPQSIGQDRISKKPLGVRKTRITKHSHRKDN